ncbi:bifunctional UDP-sugar hydrolase/5'-nucleotidase [Bacillus sp. JCM 19034]|uniref:bifunctional metallophosphatase/5'-nucleotidase n=1 Tax=Bacillus sp. JCM 19034 TaxID=1481928 RepID=UPI00078308B0|nr:bifunctional UDP-sugar hydrolase/5'-nucleotidase [Bacillus sp. JCM 19034]
MGFKQVRLFHTNDIHSSFDYWSSIVKYIKQNRDDNTLYVDIGDHTDRSHPITEATLGKGNIALLNEAAVDYVTIGNNEGITFSFEQLDQLYMEAQFKIILANLEDQNGKRPSWCTPYEITSLINGVKVGFIGLTAPFSRFYEQLGWRVLNPEEVLLQWLPIVKKKADIVVVLSHLGLHADRKLAEGFNGIDVIIGGHTHHVLHEGEQVNETLIVQAGKYGTYLGEITLYIDQAQHMVIKKQATLHHYSKRMNIDKHTTNLLDTLAIKAKRLLMQPVATLPKDFEVNWFEETELVKQLCDALTKWCGQSIGMLNAGVLLHSLKKGTISKGDLLSVCPHPINPCVVPLSGKELKEVIIRGESKDIQELELKGFGFRGKVLGKTIFSGLTYEYDRDRNDVNSVVIQGEPLIEHETYLLATLDMYTFGHLFPMIAESEEKRFFMPEVLRDVLEFTIKEIGSS